MAKTRHLVKVIVQTVWVEVDSETGHALERVGGAAPIPAAEWNEGFYARWKRDWDMLAAPAPEPEGEAVLDAKEPEATEGG